MRAAVIGTWMLGTAAALAAAPDDRFLGGAFDGHAAALRRTYVRHESLPWFSPRFTGGPCDGHAHARRLVYQRDGSSPWFSGRFSGGAYDGFATATRRTYDAVSAQHLHAPRFRGGALDGHARMLVLGLPNPLAGDVDADGLPDWWEALHYNSILATDAAGDSDADGATAWHEWIAGTNPTNDLSVFECLHYTQDESSGAGWIIRWSSVTGHFYSVSRSTNLQHAAAEDLAIDLPATPPENVWTNSEPPGRFEVLRIRVTGP